MFAQIDSVGTLEEGQDTRNLSVISEDFFACNCDVSSGELHKTACQKTHGQ